MQNKCFVARATLRQRINRHIQSLGHTVAWTGSEWLILNGNEIVDRYSDIEAYARQCGKLREFEVCK